MTKKERKKVIKRGIFDRTIRELNRVIANPKNSPETIKGAQKALQKLINRIQ